MKFSRFSKILLIVLFALCVCYANYFYTSKSVEHSEKKYGEKITIDCKTLTKRESLKSFGKDVLKVGYMPITISIENESDHYIKFSATDITLKTIPAELVAKKVHNKTFLRTIIWKIGSIFSPLLSLPGAAHSALEENASNKLDRKFLLQTASDRLIGPQEKIKNVIFVAQPDYQNEFTILLADKNSQNTIACKINLENKAPFVYIV